LKWCEISIKTSYQIVSISTRGNNAVFACYNRNAISYLLHAC